MKGILAFFGVALAAVIAAVIFVVPNVNFGQDLSGSPYVGKWNPVSYTEQGWTWNIPDNDERMQFCYYNLKPNGNAEIERMTRHYLETGEVKTDSGGGYSYIHYTKFGGSWREVDGGFEVKSSDKTYFFRVDGNTAYLDEEHRTTTYQHE